MVIGSNINNYFECKWIKCSNWKTNFLSGYKKKKKNLYVYSQPETHFRPSDTYRLKVRGCKKILHANGKKNGVAILVLDNIDFKIETATRDKEGHYIMIKGSIQEAITIISICAPNMAVPQYIRQMLTNLKGKSTVKQY